MANRVITISREFGSGGRTIGSKLAKKLGIPCYDQDAIETLMTQAEQVFAGKKEKSGDPRKWLADLKSDLKANKKNTRELSWELQCMMIEELASKGDCVMVGRCADYILKDKHNCLRVFIYSSYEDRAKRIVEVYGETDEPTMRRLKDKDRSREAYYYHYTGNKWGDRSNFDVAMNSGALGIDACVEALAKLF